jgi:hypothetical protein
MRLAELFNINQYKNIEKKILKCNATDFTLIFHISVKLDSGPLGPIYVAFC